MINKNHYRQSKKQSNNKYGLIFLVILIIYIVITAFLPFPKIEIIKNQIKLSDNFETSIDWPDYGQSAIGAVGYGLLAKNGPDTSVPIASIAKTMMALAVVKEKPLKLGETGPTITLTQKDVDLYKSYLAINGSNVPVSVGEKITEYQLIQALLLPSGDNIADTLANWVFGSKANYLIYANNYAKKLGMSNTYFDDESGLSPKTISTASDLVILAQEVMKEPVLAEIVGQSEVNLPVAGVMHNYNVILGKENVVGIKTGTTEEAGGCFMFASKKNIEGKDVILVGAILGAKTRPIVLKDTLTFLETNTENLHFTKAVSAGQTVGIYKAPWGKEISAIASRDVILLTIGKEKITTDVNLQEIKKPTRKNTEVGVITANFGTSKLSSPITLKDKISGPSIFWKMFHPLSK